MNKFTALIAMFLSIAFLTVQNARAATVSVSCPSKTISGAIADATLNTPLTINVSGACVENITIPPGLVVEIIAKAGTTLKQKLASGPALTVRGYASINRLTISSDRSSESLVEVISGGQLALDSSSLQSSTVDTLLQASKGGYARIYNTNIIGGQSAALSASSAGIDISAYAGNSIRISSPNGNGGDSIGCYQSQLNISAQKNSTVIIGPGPQGLSARGCSASVGSGNGGGKVRFIGNTDTAVRAKAGDSIKLRNVEILNNSGMAAEVSAGSIEIDASTIKDNGYGLFAKRSGTIYFNNIQGTSTVSGTTPFRCYQNGHIYAETNSLVGAKSTNCLTVGGSITY